MLNIGFLKGQETIDLNLAKSYFHELDTLCKLDNGNLWGISLYGATMFVFPENRRIVANENDNEGNLVYNDGLYLGTLPDNVNIANTSIEWNGKQWTMVGWEFISPNDKYVRGKLLVHESWHRNQTKIGIKPVMTENPYLDELQGSILLKLEFIALSRALNSEGENKVDHLTNALIIRAYRQSMFPENNENLFELHEGMAEYTGFRLCGMDPKMLPKVLARQLETAINKEGLANSFPYFTGPAYGVLFDGLKENWRYDVKKGRSLPEIGGDIVKGNIPTDTITLQKSIQKLISLYGADSLIIRETEKFENQKQRIDRYKQKFFKDDILIIRNNNINMRFNPQETLVPVENGIVYETMRLTGEWGIAEVKNGIFRSNDWQFFIISAPQTKKTGTIHEVDYDLMLNDGWEVVEIKNGKYTLNKK